MLVVAGILKNTIKGRAASGWAPSYALSCQNFSCEGFSRSRFLISVLYRPEKKLLLYLRYFSIKLFWSGLSFALLELPSVVQFYWIRLSLILWRKSVFFLWRKLSRFSDLPITCSMLLSVVFVVHLLTFFIKCLHQTLRITLYFLEELIGTLCLILPGKCFKTLNEFTILSNLFF